MELKLNTKCQLIVDGLPEIASNSFVEIIMHVSDPKLYITINRKDNELVYDMQKDGLYFYYYFEYDTSDSENIEEDIIKWFNKNKAELETKKLSIYSISKLRNCLLKLEKNAIRDFVNLCNKSNCKSKLRSEMDFLLVAIFVLENLICQQRFSEADSILDSISTCSLCNDINSKSLCNCNE